jgi:NADH-quinone oxidoreductase subunit L
MGIAAALMTAFYSWRLLIVTFHGSPRASAEVMSHVHESPLVMTIPLLVLAVGAVFAGWLGYNTFVGDGMDAFWGSAILVLEGNNTVKAAHHVPTWVKLLPIFVGIAGIALAYWIYMLRPGTADKIVAALRPVYSFFFNKWYFDELYDWLFVRPALRLGRIFWKTGDGDIIDGYGPDGVSAAARFLAGRAAVLQSGYVYHYAFAMLIGVVVILSWYLIFHGG